MGGRGGVGEGPLVQTGLPLTPFEMWRSHTQTSLGVQSEPSYNTHTLIPFSQKAHRRMPRGQTSDFPPTAPRPFPGFPEIRTVSSPPPLDLILSHTHFSPYSLISSTTRLNPLTHTFLSAPETWLRRVNPQTHTHTHTQQKNT